MTRSISNLGSRTMWPRICAVVGLGVLATAGSLVGPGPVAGASSSASDQTVGLGITESLLSQAPALLAESAGYYGQHHLKVNVTTLSSANTELAALLAGDVQFIAGAASTILSTDAAGGDLIAVAGMMTQTEEVCIAKSYVKSHDIKLKSSIHDRLHALKGATVGATGTASSSYTDMALLLQEYGDLNPATTVTMISVGSASAQVPAILSGHTQAFLQSPPDCQEASSGAEVVVKPTQISKFGSSANTVIYTTRSYADSHPSIVRDFARAVAEADTLLASKSTKSLHLLAKSYSSLSPSLLKTAVLNDIAPATLKGGKMDLQMWNDEKTLLEKEATSKVAEAKENVVWTNKYL
jgi:ABC-type nitrate/sulfonate/bicarbonate transport system substrate-binding protein